jgi:hypothetical protein
VNFIYGVARIKLAKGLENIVLIMIACLRDPHGTTVLRTPLVQQFF